MRILFIGNHAAPHSTESDIRKTLELMGHEVMAVQESHDPGPDLVRRSADICIWMHTHGWDWVGMSDVIERAPWPIVAITLDLFRGLARHDPAYVETHPWFRSRYFFSPDSPDWLRARGVNAYFSPPAILESSCYVSPIDSSHEAYGKVVFVGSRTYHPEWPWRAQLIDWLEKTYSKDFLLYEHSSGLRGDRLNQVYANAAVVVGDSCFASPDSPYTSDRLFETLGRGGRLIYPDIDHEALGHPLVGALWDIYRPGSTDTGLRRPIDMGLEEWPPDPEEAQQRVAYIRDHHTYKHRLQRILETVAKEEGR